MNRCSEGPARIGGLRIGQPFGCRPSQCATRSRDVRRRLGSVGRVAFSNTQRPAGDPSGESTVSKHSDSGRAASAVLKAKTSRPLSSPSTARPKPAQNSIWPAMDRCAISAVRRASRTRESESLTGWLIKAR